MTLLVVSATPQEAAYVPGGAAVLVTGIGKVPAAAAVARALASDGGIDQVVNIGSAGALHDHLEGLHEIGSVLNHDLSAGLLRQLGVDPQEWLDLPADGLRLATGDLFVTDPVVRAGLAAVADLVDMEGYAVAWAAQQAGVPVRLVKHVSDRADEASMDWPQLVDVSARALGAWLADHL
ncbi:nucleosidase [Nocardioides sp. CER19]|uniref:nucleosidase n=1 Tax=Nocardioides sp. CER19 TaxID=3038538 RepID=UPI0024497DA7|nr:nucleosidase [Nocardioides sp. CER19]MDH2415707.1 nucleosidase [Nocardioides sp. CER19]